MLRNASAVECATGGGGLVPGGLSAGTSDAAPK